MAILNGGQALIRSMHAEEAYNRIRPHSSLGYMPRAPEKTSLPTPTPVLVGLT